LILGEISDSGHDLGFYGEAKSREIFNQSRTISRAVYNRSPRFEIRADNGLVLTPNGRIMMEDRGEEGEMSEKKRVPPWERAQLNFTLAERRRLRQVEEKERPGKARLLDLEENRKRLAEIRKHFCPDCQRYIRSDQLAREENKIGEEQGFCKCAKNNPQL
jgi:hypothetical protein